MIHDTYFMMLFDLLKEKEKRTYAQVVQAFVESLMASAAGWNVVRAFSAFLLMSS